jgi:cobalt-zinc-cadmium efflux system outer membrane protein
LKKARRVTLHNMNVHAVLVGRIGLTWALLAQAAFGQASPGPLKIMVDEAIQMALQHNHNLLGARTTVQQSQAQEITANLHPNPTLFADWEYLPIFSPGSFTKAYLSDLTEVDVGLSYLFERGNKRRHRVEAARDATAVTRSQVVDTERTLSFQVASLFINVQLAESTLDVAQENLKSFQASVDLSETRYKSGGISENDYLKMQLQLLQFQTDVQQAQLARVQALSDLRQQVGYESVSADYDVVGAFEYQPFPTTLAALQMKAMDLRPDLRAAQLGVTAANSQHSLAKANAKQDFTLSATYSHVNGLSASNIAVSVPLPIFDRNQGEIARTHYAMSQAQQQELTAHGQVMTDVKEAYEALQTSERVLQRYRSGYLEVARKNRDISEFAYRRGAASLLDFLDAERSYRATQLAYRQTLAAYLTALEQVRQAVGTRSLP